MERDRFLPVLLEVVLEPVVGLPVDLQVVVVVLWRLPFFQTNVVTDVSAKKVSTSSMTRQLFWLGIRQALS
jgi:hypothetical protein